MSSHVEPHNYKEVSKDSCWIQAMKEELSSLEANQTQTITILPPGKIAIDCY